MYLLDTDVLIDIQRGYPPALAWFAGLSDVPSVPGFVVMELIQGTHNTAELRQVQRMVAPLPAVWPGVADCQRALSDFTAYRLSHNVGLLDSLIAACTIGLSAALHFQSQTLPPYSRPGHGPTLHSLKI